MPPLAQGAATGRPEGNCPRVTPAEAGGPLRGPGPPGSAVREARSHVLRSLVTPASAFAGTGIGWPAAPCPPMAGAIRHGWQPADASALNRGRSTR